MKQLRTHMLFICPPVILCQKLAEGKNAAKEHSSSHNDAATFASHYCLKSFALGS